MTQLQAGVDAVLVDQLVSVDHIVGVFLRGSVAQGHAVAGISDIDLALYVLRSHNDANAIAPAVAPLEQNSSRGKQGAPAHAGRENRQPCWPQIRNAMLLAADSVVQRSSLCVKCGAQLAEPYSC